MEMWWSCLLLVLLYGPGFSSSLVRHRRQSDAWWRNSQPGWGSSRGLGHSPSRVGAPRGNPWPQSVSGLGALRGVSSVGIQGSRYPGGVYQPRQLPQPSSPISVQCGEDSMVVTVSRDFYGNGKLVKPTDLTLGTCGFGTQTTDTMVVFDNGLQDCGNSLQITQYWLIYNSNLQYAPTSSSSVPIIRSSPALVPIQCYYPRKAIKPTWIPFSTTVTTEERLAFSLRLMTVDWSAPSSSLVFQLGDTFYIEASLDTQNHVPMMLFVDNCVATLTADVTSSPSYNLIAYNGCLMDGMQDDASSAFVSPRPEADKLRFTVDAFRFTNSDLSTIFITCSLRAADINQTPDPMNKACSYNKASSSWAPVEGPSSICQCCTTGNCATSAGQRMTWGSSHGRSRGHGKRDVGFHLENHGVAILGPLLVTGAMPNQLARAETIQASRLRAGQEPLQLWQLVAIGSVSAVVLAVALTVVGKCLLKRLFNKESV